MPGAKFEAEEILERARQTSPATRRPACAPAACRPRRSHPTDGSYILASSLTSVVLPAPFSPTIATTAPAGSSHRHIVQHHARRAGIGKRNVVEPDAAVQARREPADRPMPRRMRRSPRATRAGASHPSRIRAGIRSRRRWRRCRPTAAHPRPAPAAPGWPARAGRTKQRRPRPRTRRPKIAHANACHSAEPQRAAATGPYQRSHAARRSVIRRSPMPVTRTSLPGGAVVAMVNR